jgi:glycosyltransferase involved in cell wall biosynthesis
MIIAIDANEANLTKNRVGINQYSFYLIHELHKIKSRHRFIIYLKNPPMDDLPKRRDGWEYRVIPFPRLWTQTRLPFDLYFNRIRPDVFFSTTHYAPRFCPVPSVVSIMDLGFLKSPEQFTSKDLNQLRNWTKYSVRQAKKIIAISQSTKDDIIQEYKKSPEDIKVIPLAYDKKIFFPRLEKESAATLIKYNIKTPYFYFIGSLKPSKNIKGIVNAFYLLRNNHKKHSLVISGKKAWMYEEIFNEVKKLKIEDRVLFTDFVKEEEVPYLMSRADAFICPSLYEGFGIPVLEAMACGLPVIVSKTTSMPEVAGNAGIYVDPLSHQSILNGLQEALNNKKKYTKLSLERVKSYGWDKTAQDTLSLLEHIDG